MDAFPKIPRLNEVPNLKLSESPSVAVFKELMYVVHQGGDNDQELWYSTFDGRTWTPDVQICEGLILCDHSPAVTVLGDTLYVFYKSPNTHIYYATFDGDSWVSHKMPISGATTCDSPAAATLNNTLYVVYQDNTGNGTLWYATSSDGRNWSGSTSIPSPYPASGPASLAVFNNMLYIAYFSSQETTVRCISLTPQGEWGPNVYTAISDQAGYPAMAAHSTTVWKNDNKVSEERIYIALLGAPTVLNYSWMYPDPSKPGRMGNWSLAETAYSAYSWIYNTPALVSYSISPLLYEYELYWFIRGEDQTLNWGKLLQPTGRAPNVFLSGIPAPVVFNNILYVFHQGGQSPQSLWYTPYNAEQWDSDTPIPFDSVQVGSSPSATVFNDRLYVFHKGAANEGIYYISCDESLNWQLPEQSVTGATTAAGPAVATFNGKLYVAYQDSNNSGKLFYNSSVDGVNWQGNQTVPALSLAIGAPALVVMSNTLYLAYQASGGNEIRYIPLDANEVWGQDQLMTGEYSEQPALANFKGMNTRDQQSMNAIYAMWNSGRGFFCYTRMKDGRQFGPVRIIEMDAKAQGISPVQYDNEFLVFGTGDNNTLYYIQMTDIF